MKPLLSRRQYLTLLSYAASAYRLHAGQTPTFSTEVKVVNIFATVRNKSGQIVRNLNKDEFTILENGKPQAIRYFSRESDLPLSIGLLVDTSLSQTRVLEDERGASYRFLDQVLRPDQDKASVVQFDQAVVIRQGLTGSRKDLESTLALLDSPNQQEAANGSGTLLYNAVRTAAIQLMRQQNGRKAFIVLTDGVDVGSDVTLTDAIESAQRANTLVYCILFSDEAYYGRILGPSGKGGLQRLSRETGGSFFEVTKAQSIEQIYNIIQEELRSEYSIGFVSNQPVTASGFRKIKLAVNQKALIVQSTNRYYAET